MTRLAGVKRWYEKYEGRISVGSLFFGFIVDYLTLQRVDALRENLWIASNLFLVGLCIILMSRRPADQHGFWIPSILQFSFGALLGSFFVFYFKSGTLSVAWPFLLIILFAMMANELYQKKYAKLAFQLSFFYFSLFSFFIFLVPLLVREIGPAIFILSGGMSLFGLWIYIFILNQFARERFIEARTHIWSLVSVIFLGINIFYFTNLIPPIPLSLKDSGIYLSIEKNSVGDYVVTGAKKGLERFYNLRESVPWREGQALYAYSAIYSPGSINVSILHEWQRKNEKGEWKTTTVIPLYLSGGRSGGFRTYSKKFNFDPGEWRVNVETTHGQVIGRLRFRIEPNLEAVELVEEIKY